MAFLIHLSSLFKFKALYALGFFAQLLFFSRMLVQWILSEKHKTSVSPEIFWILSLIASLLMMIYGFFQFDFVIILGQLIGYFIYIRNLSLKDFFNFRFSFVTYLFLILFPLLLLSGLFLRHSLFFSFSSFHLPTLLVSIGLLGQFIFSFRFVYQWLYSESKHTSVLPYGFWLISFFGSAFLIVYALFRHDLVLFLGQFFGLFIYLRNLFFFKHTKTTHA